MQNEKLFNHLADLLVKAHQKDEQFVNSLKALGAEIDSGLLEEFKDDLELSLVLAAGGTEGHFEYVSSGDTFYDFQRGNITKEQLVNEIQEAIENDFTGEIPMFFTVE
jgi:hypothetical protein